MTTRETPFTAGTPCWVDLQTAGLAAAATFYATVLGWELAEAGPGGSLMARSGGRPVAGMIGNRGGATDRWSTYLTTDDIEVTVAAATSPTVRGSPSRCGPSVSRGPWLCSSTRPVPPGCGSP